jgi:hypothetical protein
VAVESAETRKQKRLREEHDAGYEGLIDDIQKLAGKDLGESVRLLQDCRNMHKVSLQLKQQAEEKARVKAEKVARRAAKLTGK